MTSPRETCPHCGAPISKERLTAERIVRVVAREWDVRVEELTGKGKRRTLSNARDAVRYLCRTLLQYSYAEVAGVLNEDHTVSIHGIRRAYAQIRTNALLFVERIGTVERELRS